MLKLLSVNHYTAQYGLNIEYTIEFNDKKMKIEETLMNSGDEDHYHIIREITVKISDMILSYQRWGDKITWGTYCPPEEFNLDLFRKEVWKCLNIDIPVTE